MLQSENCLVFACLVLHYIERVREFPLDEVDTAYQVAFGKLFRIGYGQSLYNLDEMKIDPKRLAHMTPVRNSGMKGFVQEFIFRSVLRKNFKKKLQEQRVSLADILDYLKNQKSTSRVQSPRAG